MGLALRRRIWSIPCPAAAYGSPRRKKAGRWRMVFLRSGKRPPGQKSVVSNLPHRETPLVKLTPGQRLSRVQEPVAGFCESTASMIRCEQTGTGPLRNGNRSR
jgi:hypothetical protein